MTNKEELPTSWEVDLLTDADYLSIDRSTVSEEEGRQIEEAREMGRITVRNVMELAAESAERKAIGVSTLSDPNNSQSSVEFVMGCYEEAGFPLMDSLEVVSPLGLRSSERLYDLYTIGEEVLEGSLLRGDLLYFNNDRFVGIHTGSGDFISFGIVTENGIEPGVITGNIWDGMWSKYFKGHVQRVHK